MFAIDVRDNGLIVARGKLNGLDIVVAYRNNISDIIVLKDGDLVRCMNFFGSFCDAVEVGSNLAKEIQNEIPKRD